MLHQLDAYEVRGAKGQLILRSMVGSVEHATDTCATCVHATRRPSYDVPVAMLGDCHGRATLGNTLTNEQTTTAQHGKRDVARRASGTS